MRILTGICVYPGKVEGRIKFYDEKAEYTKKDIVVLNEWLTRNIFKIRKAGGVISSTGGLTCHASILAREFAIPSLVEVRELDSLNEGQLAELDSANEEVIIK